MNTGPMFTSIAAVPASMRCSAAFSSTLYAPSHSRPHSTRRPASDARRQGVAARGDEEPERRARAASSRPSVSGPADRSSPAARMPTKAEAHSTTVTRAAAVPARWSSIGRSLRGRRFGAGRTRRGHPRCNARARPGVRRVVDPRRAAAARSLPRRPGRPHRGGQVGLGRAVVRARAGRLLRRAPRGRRPRGPRPAREPRRVRGARPDRGEAPRARAGDGDRLDGPGGRAPRGVARARRAARRPRPRGRGRGRGHGRARPQPRPRAARAGRGRHEPAARRRRGGRRARRGGLGRRASGRPGDARPARPRRRAGRRRPPARGSAAARVRPAGPALRLARPPGDHGPDARRGRARRRGDRVHEPLGDGPLPPDPAGRARVGGHAGELHHARLPGGRDGADPPRHARHRHPLPQPRARGQARRDARRALRRSRRSAASAPAGSSASTGSTAGATCRRWPSASRAWRTRSSCCRSCGAPGRRASRAARSPSARRSATRGRCRSASRSSSAGRASGGRYASSPGTPTPATCSAIPPRCGASSRCCTSTAPPRGATRRRSRSRISRRRG